MVGHIRILVEEEAHGIKLKDDLQTWLSNWGWQDQVSLSFEKLAKEASVEFIPGEFQSNLAQKISLNPNATFADLQEPLAKWLYQVLD